MKLRRTSDSRPGDHVTLAGRGQSPEVQERASASCLLRSRQQNLDFALRRDTAFIEPHFNGTGVKTQASCDLEIRYAPGAAQAANTFRMQREQLGNFDDVQELFHNNDLSPFEI